LEQGCDIPYAGKNLFITSSSGKITAKINVRVGFYNKVCVECRNAAGSKIQVDNWSVTQSPIPPVKEDPDGPDPDDGLAIRSMHCHLAYTLLLLYFMF